MAAEVVGQHRDWKVLSDFDHTRRARLQKISRRKELLLHGRLQTNDCLIHALEWDLLSYLHGCLGKRGLQKSPSEDS